MELVIYMISFLMRIASESQYSHTQKKKHTYSIVGHIYPHHIIIESHSIHIIVWVLH
jgi:hypothetical protein